MGTNSAELYRSFFRGVGGMVIADTPGGREELRRVVDARLADLVDDLVPIDDVALSHVHSGSGVTETHAIHHVVLRVRRLTGELAGTVLIGKPAAGMDTLAAMTFNSDPRHLELMRRIGRAARRPAA
ncbi:MAG: hypothetical protein ACXVIH_13780, partial [Ilumatobacteraceae bacterium]